ESHTDCVASEERVVRAAVRQKGQVTLPAAVREALQVGEDDQVEFRISPTGDVTVRGLRLIPTDQAWFWTPEWQEGERQADEELKQGLGTTYHSDEEFLKALGG